MRIALTSENVICFIQIISGKLTVSREFDIYVEFIL